MLEFINQSYFSTNWNELVEWSKFVHSNKEIIKHKNEENKPTFLIKLEYFLGIKSNKNAPVKGIKIMVVNNGNIKNKK